MRLPESWVSLNVVLKAHTFHAAWSLNVSQPSLCKLTQSHRICSHADGNTGWWDSMRGSWSVSNMVLWKEESRRRGLCMRFPCGGFGEQPCIRHDFRQRGIPAPASLAPTIPLFSSHLAPDPCLWLTTPCRPLAGVESQLFHHRGYLECLGGTGATRIWGNSPNPIIAKRIRGPDI